MGKNILITGGAGFVGSHLADRLLAEGHSVRVLDNLASQVHGAEMLRPAYLDPAVELQSGDIRDEVAVEKSLRGIDAVYHLAAVVGVGQSMYQVENYTSINGTGTAVLLEALAKHPIERLVVASSMSIYGEGLYRSSSGDKIEAGERPLWQARAHEWEVLGEDGEALTPLPTPETKTPALPSVYALSKYYQEKLCLNVCQAYDIPAVALRFFNIYGTRQALSNPYTGVLAIFAARYLNGQPPLINEDGSQRRDFVSVQDVVSACHLALEAPNAVGRAINVGSGENCSINEIAQELAAVLNCQHIEPEVTGRFRTGDIRNCFADISLARQVLGYSPKISLAQGLRDLAEWLDGQKPDDTVVEASRELLIRGLAR